MTQRGIRRLAWALVIVLAVVALAFGADSGLRAYAEKRMQSEIVKALPEGVSVPGLSVTVRGFSFLAQYLAGSFDQVDVDAPQIRTGRATVSASLEAYQVRIDRSFRTAPVLGRVQGGIEASQAAVNGLVQLPGATSALKLRRDAVAYTGSTEVLGLPIDYTATVRPVAAGKVVNLYPQGVSVGSGQVQFDVQQLVGSIFDGDKPIPVCIAPYLPSGLDVGKIALTTGRARVDFSATDFALDAATFSKHDSCPAP